DIFVAVAGGGGTQRGKVAAGLRFGPGLRPDFIARSHGGQEARLLLRAAELHQRRTEQEDAVLVDAARRLGAVIFFLEDQPLDQVATAAAIFPRPGDHAPLALGESLLPLPVRAEAFDRVVGSQRLLRHIRLHPRAYFG